MEILAAMHAFEEQYDRTLSSGGKQWHYYRLGHGSPILWLTGGLRRTALGFSFLEMMAEKHTVIAPDYPTLHSIDEFLRAMDDILKVEKTDRIILAGQSYGSLLAQAFLAVQPERVDVLVISSGGPADYSRIWLAADYLAMGLVRVLPEKTIKNMLVGGLLKALPLPEGQKEEWLVAIRRILKDELTREDVYSHFAVAADMINKHVVRPDILNKWRGRVIVLGAANDPTQSGKDLPRYERLFGRPVEWVDLGNMGHAALLFNPRCFLDILEEALTG